MAAFTDAQKTKIRQALAADNSPDWDKKDINLAIQATEDWFESNRLSIAAAIDVATSPYIFTNPIKKKIVKSWLLSKWGIE